MTLRDRPAPLSELLSVVKPHRGVLREPDTASDCNAGSKPGYASTSRSEATSKTGPNLPPLPPPQETLKPLSSHDCNPVLPQQGLRDRRHRPVLLQQQRHRRRSRHLHETEALKHTQRSMNMDIIALILPKADPRLWCSHVRDDGGMWLLIRFSGRWRGRHHFDP